MMGAEELKLFKKDNANSSIGDQIYNQQSAICAGSIRVIEVSNPKNIQPKTWSQEGFYYLVYNKKLKLQISKTKMKDQTVDLINLQYIC